MNTNVLQQRIQCFDEALDVFGCGVVDEGGTHHAVVQVQAERFDEAVGVEVPCPHADIEIRQIGRYLR